MQSNWSPSIRAAAGLTGAGLLAYAFSQRNVFGWACGVVGAGCLTRSITNREFTDMLPSSETMSSIPEKASRMASRVGETVSDAAGRARTRVSDLTQRRRTSEEAGALQTP
jgi:hypothetical protein